jgi:alanine-glyoxylate transaminase/serine-glyoxylate transaminase/serine-pyruvate transaminase
MLMGTLSGIEMGLRLAGVPHKKGGLMAALDRLDPAGTAATELEMGAGSA